MESFIALHSEFFELNEFSGIQSKLFNICKNCEKINPPMSKFSITFSAIRKYDTRKTKNQSL